MIFEGDVQDTCSNCGDFRVLDAETWLCKDCWREYTTEMEGDKDD